MSRSKFIKRTELSALLRVESNEWEFWRFQMKTQLFKTISSAVVAGALMLGTSALGYAAPAPQYQDPAIQEAPDQNAPQYNQAAPQYQDQGSAQYAAPQYDDQAPAIEQAPAPSQQQYQPLSADQMQQLVAPIALYPDALVAQILAASSYPTQIVEANRFVKENPDLKGRALGDAIDQQDWDPSVKALCQFPSVLANMDKDLSWTSELGDANVNQQADVMNAIQYMRHQAQKAGHLQTTQQQSVTEQGDDIDIAPTDPDVVYVPEYDPALVYGYPVTYWPG